MNNPRSLEIWKLSYELGKSIHMLTKKFPREEMYGLASQLRRASVSVTSNISEGCGRGSPKDFKNFLHISMGSLKEVETQILYAKDFGYISEQELKENLRKIDKLGRKLSCFIASVAKRI